MWELDGIGQVINQMIAGLQLAAEASQGQPLKTI